MLGQLSGKGLKARAVTGSIFADDVKFEPYWWEEAPRPSLPQEAVPEGADVAIVGSGYTGLSAALTLVRGGREVVVFEAGEAGIGASSRSGGICGDSLKLGLDALRRRHGDGGAAALIREGQRALEYTAQLIESEQIECAFHRSGRFTGAHKPGRYEVLGREADTLAKEFGFETYMVPRAEQHAEVGTELYHGGRVMAHHGGLHPALYHQGLLDRVRGEGVKVLAHTPVTGIVRERDRFLLETPRGRVAAREVVVASNGYTTPATPELRRRLIPIASSIIATAPLKPEVMARLMPKGRMLGDSRINLVYYRPSPDGTRIVFGGRASIAELDPRISGVRLYKLMTALFPEIDGVRVSHSWSGYIAYSFDKLPHIGVRDGLHFAMSYCGSGVVMATYLGHKTGLKVLGSPEGATAFDGLDFPTRPFYRGRPWFLPAAALYYRLVDRLVR
ncbi:MAG: FAD-binding oxidoreductase [Alphaproteobacteria bacterium]|nr:FAD-binding oxidoreductase [Alphaproteobacteria bacterium]